MRLPDGRRLAFRRGLAGAAAAVLLLAGPGDAAAQATPLAPDSAGTWVRLEARARAALRVTPEEGDLHATLAEALWRQGKIAEAERSAREAVRLDAGHPVYHGVLGQILLVEGRWTEAEAEFRAALGADSLNVEHRVGLGHALLAQGRRAEAEEVYGRARALDPEHPDLRRAEGALRVTPEDLRDLRASAAELAPWPIRVLSAIFRGVFAAIMLAAGGVLAVPVAGTLYLLFVRAPLHLLRRRSA